MRAFLPPTLLALLLTVAGALPAPAAARDEGPGLSRAEAARQARQQVGGGRILDIRREGGGYAVKVLHRGRVQVVRIRGARRGRR